MATTFFNTNKITKACRATAANVEGVLDETVAGKSQSIYFKPSTKSEHICIYVRNNSSTINYVIFGKGDYVSAQESDKVFIEPQSDFFAFVDTGACLKNDGSIELIFIPESSTSLSASDITVKVVEFVPVVNH